MMNHSYIATERPMAVVASANCKDAYDLAVQFAHHRYDIIIAANNPSVIEEAEEFKEMGVDAVSYQLDLSSSEGIEQLYGRIVATGRPVEALIINRGLSPNYSRENELAKKALKDMIDRGHGRILLSGCAYDQKCKAAYEALQKSAHGTGVMVAVLETDHNQLYFLHEEEEDIMGYHQS